MVSLNGQVVIWVLSGIQIAGLSSAWLARLSEGSRSQTICQWLFFGCLALVGATTVFAMSLGPGCWLLTGSTLGVMVLAAVWDFRGAELSELV